jgi:hypothetical protein
VNLQSSMVFAILLTLGTILSTGPLLGCSGFYVVDSLSYSHLGQGLLPVIDTSSKHPVPPSPSNEILKEPFSEEEEDNELVVDHFVDPTNREIER